MAKSNYDIAEERLGKLRSIDADAGPSAADVTLNTITMATMVKSAHPYGIAAMAGGELGSLIVDTFDTGGMLASVLAPVTGLNRMPKEGPDPAVLGMPIAHSKARWGAWLGAAAGLLLGGALIVATGGLATGLVVGAAVVLASTTVVTVVSDTISKALADLGSNCGQITSASPDVSFENRKVARVTDTVYCEKCGKESLIVHGSETISVNALPLARIAHVCECGAKISDGVKSVKADMTTGIYGASDSEVSGWDLVAIAAVSFIAGKVGRKAIQKVKPRLSQLKPVFKKKCAKDPIDTVTGEFVDWRTDFTYESILPLRLERVYLGKGITNGLLGNKWQCNWSERLWFLDDNKQIIYEEKEGVAINFVSTGDEYDNLSSFKFPKYKLSGNRSKAVIFNQDDQLFYIFEPSQIEDRCSFLTQIKDRNGNHIDFLYDNGFLVEIIHSDGAKFKVDVDDYGHLKALYRKDYDEALVQYEYDKKFNLLVAKGHLTSPMYYQYNEKNWITCWHDTGATQVFYKYDRFGRVINVSTPQGYYNAEFRYYPKEKRTDVLSVDGRIESYFYNNKKMVIKEVNAAGQIFLYKYNHCDDLIEITDPIGRKSKLSYDKSGNVITFEEHNSKKSEFTYNEFGQPVIIRHADGLQENMLYDQNGNVIKFIDTENTETLFTYDDRGRLISHQLQNQRPIEFIYNHSGRLDRVKNQFGGTEWFKFDFWGRVLRYGDAEGNFWNYEYQKSIDNPYKNVSKITNPDQGVETFEYDSEGLVKETFRNGQSLGKRRYGAFDTLEEVIDADNQPLQFYYDNEKRLSSVVNSRGKKWSFTYDGANRVVEEIDFAGRITKYKYDLADRLISKIKPDGDIHHLSWDDNDNLIKITTSDRSIIYCYDESDRLIKAETICEDEVESQVLFYYDNLGRLSKEIQNGEEIDYRYDETGRCINRTSPSGELERIYDPRGLLQAYVSNQKGFSFSYNYNGDETKRQASHGLTQTLAYDACGRITHQTVGAFPSRIIGQKNTFERRFEWDKSGRLINVMDSLRGNTHYNYDKRDQVTTVTQSFKKSDKHRQFYDYDALMNLASSDEGKFTYNSQGEVIQIGDNRYSYDDLGRVVSRTIIENGFRPKTWHYEWDSFDHLIAVRTPDGSKWRYTYDAFNRRVSKECVTVGRESKTSFLWEGTRLSEEWTHTSRTRWHYQEETFIPIAKEVVSANGESIGFFPIITDQVGTPQELFDEAGQRRWFAQQNLWGKYADYFKIGDPKDDEFYHCKLRFQGQYEDIETGLYYNLNRYYDPLSGAYLSPDPIGLQGGFRPHGYVINPLEWIDPWGLKSCPEKRLKNLIKNAFDGLMREIRVGKKLRAAFGKDNVYSQRTLRTADGKRAIDVDTKTGRRVDFVVRDKNGKLRPIEVTSKTADKTLQNAKDQRIRANGGDYIRDPKTKKLLKLDSATRTIRVK